MRKTVLFVDYNKKARYYKCPMLCKAILIDSCFACTFSLGLSNKYNHYCSAPVRADEIHKGPIVGAYK